jgi:O-antigen/teichoic acid export membrane protein
MTAASPAGDTGAQLRHSSSLGRASAVGNFVAQAGALACLSLASLLVARVGGPAVLGQYALLRVLPWLLGVLASSGLPVASTYFLARRADATLRSTLILIAGIGSVVGTVLWLLASRPLQRWFFPDIQQPMMVLAGACVVTQLLSVWAKACCQGYGDLRGANFLIVWEELSFLPAYVLVLVLGLRGDAAMVTALVLGGTITTLSGLLWLSRHGFFRELAAPSRKLAREVAGYGARGELGNLLWLMNLRLDFLVLSVLSGPAVLGVYAVATKFSELMRLPATAVNYVLYPRFSRQEASQARAELDTLLPRVTLLIAASAPLLVIGVTWLLPVLYGNAFTSARTPAYVLVLGLSVEGAAAVSSAYLWGIGRPGLNTWAMAAGVVVTVALDLVLIPQHGALGAAVASTVAYLLTTSILTVFALRSSAHKTAGAEVRPSPTAPTPGRS